MPSESYLTKTFEVESGDARIRDGSDLAKLLTYSATDATPPGKKAGDVKIIPKGTKVKVTKIKIFNGAAYGLAQDASNAALAYGWTSTKNFKGKFVNETLGEVKPAGNEKKGPTAAWDHGSFLGQVTLVNIVDVDQDIEQVTLENLPVYEKLVADAQAAGITIALRSGFRTYAEQEYLYNGYKAGKPGFNKAAQPGASNHQHGQAFDIAVSEYDGDPTYDWLKVNGPKHGFIRTVNKEPWHWEYRPKQAAKLAAKGQHKAAGVTK